MSQWYLGLSLIVTLFFNAPLTAENAPQITWQMLKEMNYETGDMPDNIKKLNGQLIRIEGFIVPLEMDEYADEVKEFLLVPDQLSCIHVPPPPPNQIIYVVMNQKIPVDMDYRGVEIKGTLHFVQSNDGIYGFDMIGKSAKEADIEYEDPLLELLNIDIDE